MSYEPKGIDELQAEIAGAYRNFKPSGDTRRLADQWFTDVESANAEVATLREQLSTLQAENAILVSENAALDEALTRYESGETIKALREQVERMPVCVGYLCYEDYQEFSVKKMWAQTIASNPTTVYRTPVYIDPPAEGKE